MVSDREFDRADLIVEFPSGENKVVFSVTSQTTKSEVAATNKIFSEQITFIKSGYMDRHYPGWAVVRIKVYHIVASQVGFLTSQDAKEAW